MDSARIRTHLYLHSDELVRPLQVEAYGLRRIGVITPTESLDAIAVGKIQCAELQWADPKFMTSAGVDAILGANTYSHLLRPGLHHLDGLLAQRTIFGWILTGRLECQSPASTAITCTAIKAEDQESWHEQIIGLLQRFWSVEEVPRAVRHSQGDAVCEEIYTTQHSRDETGRYVVPLPVRSDDCPVLGSSFPGARLALDATHRRMQRDSRLRAEYTRFMTEYIRLGHMRPLTQKELDHDYSRGNYIPHHGVWQRSDDGSKLRVVFNASRPTSTGHCLNDILYSGPKLQNDLASVVTRWRQHRIVFCADIKMMFRQILVRPSDTHLQRILWSPSAGQPVVHYALLTVTYGEACAPYLALRTLQQLCVDEGSPLPEAVDAIKRDLYVDDFLSGADSVEMARHRRDQLIQLLRAGGFELKKWVSNTPDLIADIPAQDRLRPSWLQFTTEGLVTELGLAWDPISDSFRFTPPLLDQDAVLTKRRVLSEIARLFDPAGWLGPIIVVAKVVLQDIWQAKLQWDEHLPEPMAQRWKQFRASLRDLKKIQISRWIRCRQSDHIQLHVFADASRRAFAAAVYSRAPDDAGNFHARLLVAKTKLAPLKSLAPSTRATTRVTIPRLELRAALLAAHLARSQSHCLGIDPSNCYGWSDSQVVLRWLHSDGPVGNDFVDNYVSHIHEVLPGARWRYVPSGDNPADLATRGTDSASLAQHPSWWSGPSWLIEHSTTWPTCVIGLAHPVPMTPQDPPELRCLTTQITPPEFTDKFSCLSRLLRAMTRCRRLLQRGTGARVAPPPLDLVSSADLEREFLVCVKAAQQRNFNSEIHELASGRPVARGSALARLNPFLDGAGALRVGGRLQNSYLSAEEKHPLILSGRCHLATLVIDWAHQRALHAGPRVTHAFTLRRAWIVGGRAKVKSYLRQCVVCAKTITRPMTQMMAPLPEARVTPSRPFSRTGVDYAGPFQVLRSKGRGTLSSKGYVAVLVCLATKAVHLELVGDLTTDSFLGALARFTGRRGRPKELWSDNGTNFRGAHLELRRLLQSAELDWARVQGSLAQDGVIWKFIPPSAPHFGGLWEAAVKSTKIHLKRVAGPRKLTYEEFSTLLVEIEMILNSRPLVPFTGDLDDLDILTPAHFLIGSPLDSLPQPSAVDTDLDHLSHWRLVRGLRDHFWKRWSREYLNTLQQRSKWTRSRQNLQVGDLVVAIDPSLMRPCGRWPIGRVLEVHPGKDGLVRVCTIRTSSGTYTRPIAKLIQLPLSPPGTRTSPSDPEAHHDRDA